MKRCHLRQVERGGYMLWDDSSCRIAFCRRRIIFCSRIIPYHRPSSPIILPLNLHDPLLSQDQRSSELCSFTQS
jgi:hypothetical protein